MPDQRISELPPISADQLEGVDLLAIADMSAAQSKAAELKAIALAGVRSLPSGAISGAQISWSGVPVPWPTLPVKGDSIADNATLTFIGGGQFIGQLQVDANHQVSYWTGANWQAVYGGVGTVDIVAQAPLTGSAGPSGTVPGEWDVTLSLRPTTAPAEFLAGPVIQGGTVGYRTIQPDDLPGATPTARGVVSVPGNGLKIVNGALVLDNSVLAQSSVFSAVTYNEYGLVTGGRALSPGDVPVAAPGSPGAVFPGPELQVGPTGELSHRSQISAGSGAKVNFNATGHITGVAALLASDIPELDAGKITTGALSTARIGDNSITLDKLADYSISYIQADQPTVVGIPIGTLWLSPLAQQIRMWDGNVWQPIGFGSLSEENLRFGGLFNAATGTITSVSEFSANLNLAPSSVIPAASSQFAGLYFVNTVAGNGVFVTPATNYNIGDWVLCISTAEGWKRIASGGGAAASTGVTSVTGTAPITVVSGTTTPVVGIAAATPTATGAMSAADKTKLDAIAAGAQVNVKPDWNAPPGNVAEILNKPASVTVPDATTTVKGLTRLASSINDVAAAVVDAPMLRAALPAPATTSAAGTVRLADATAATIGTAGVVVDAAQLKAVRDQIGAGGGGGITSVTGTAPISVVNGTTAPSISIVTATAGASGVMSPADKAKLDGIGVGAQANVKPDWNAASGAAEGILNKPVIPAAPPPASTTVAGITQLNSSTSSTAANQAATPLAVKTAYDLAENSRRKSVTITGSSFTLPINGLNFCGYIQAGTTRIVFNQPAILDATEYVIYNDSGVIVDLVVSGVGFIWRAGSGPVTATAATPAKLAANGMMTIVFTGGKALARGVT